MSRHTNTQIFIFGYGSLINIFSRKNTIPAADSAIPVKIKGFSRSWSYKCPRRQYTAVAVTRTSNLTDTINGVLIAIDKEDLPAMDKREQNYARGIISNDLIIPACSEAPLGLDSDSIVYVYENHCKFATNYSTTSANIPELQKQDQHQPSPHCPIPLSYLDCILLGCLSFGKEFAREFLQTTKGWCVRSFLNDREASLETKKYVGSLGDAKTITISAVDVLLAESRLLDTKAL